TNRRRGSGARKPTLVARRSEKRRAPDRTLIAKYVNARAHARQSRRRATRARPRQRIAPRTQRQRRARARDAASPDEQHRHARTTRGLAQPKRRAERHARRRLAGVEDDEGEARTA